MIQSKRHFKNKGLAYNKWWSGACSGISVLRWSSTFSKLQFDLLDLFFGHLGGAYVALELLPLGSAHSV